MYKNFYNKCSCIGIHGNNIFDFFLINFMFIFYISFIFDLFCNVLIEHVSTSSPPLAYTP